MAELQMTTMRLDVALLEGLELVKERDGVSMTEQVRRAIRLWLKSKRVRIKPDVKQRRKRQ